jgi:hypothetical protein
MLALLLIYFTITLVKGGAVHISNIRGLCTVYFNTSASCLTAEDTVYDLYNNIGKFPAKITEVHTPSGQIIQKCVGQIPPPPYGPFKRSKKAIKFTPTDNPCTPFFKGIVPCFGNVKDGESQSNTTDWTEVLSPSGHVELTCIFKRKKA